MANLSTNSPMLHLCSHQLFAFRRLTTTKWRLAKPASLVVRWTHHHYCRYGHGCHHCRCYNIVIVVIIVMVATVIITAIVIIIVIIAIVIIISIDCFHLDARSR